MKKARKNIEILIDYCKLKNSFVIEWIHSGEFLKDEDFLALRKVREKLFEKDFFNFKQYSVSFFLDGVIEISEESEEEAIKFFHEIFESKELSSGPLYALLIGPNGPITENT